MLLAIGGEIRYLVEMLLVTALLVILLAVSVVGVAAYLRQMQVAELDNAAREIYLAAQNRAILLQGSQRLEELTVREGGTNAIEHVDVMRNPTETIQITAYYIHCDDLEMQDLLPPETIEPSLWEGDFYIAYEPESASVVDVLFSREPLIGEGESFAAVYQDWRALPRGERMNHKPMFGYYGGGSAESGSTISLRTPVINIYNENTLWVEVTYWVPQTLFLINNEAENVELAVTLHCGEMTAELPLEGHGGQQPNPDEALAAYRTYAYTWVLDDPLTAGGVHFSGQYPDADAGGDFAITAEVSYTGTTLQINGARKEAEDNSLFARGSGGSTAYVANLRHLQNLDRDFSSVEGKTAAVQTATISALEGYTFRPIGNDALESYDGQAYELRELEIVGDGDAGLFGSIRGAELRGIRMVNASVTSRSGSAGALAGSADRTDISDCLAYWENNVGETASLREVLGDSESGIRYQITAENGFAGGLAGELSVSRIADSAAATLAAGRAAGGLAGRGENVTVESSYADCYLSGTDAAGMFGSLSGEENAIAGSYAAGFISAGANAGGLALDGSAAVSDSYSAMLFSEHSANYPLCQGGGSYDNAYYLESDRFAAGAEIETSRVSYAELTNQDNWDALFAPGTFVPKGVALSHPYNLQTTLTLTNYIYPGLALLEHYGDWGAQFQNGNLVYYEIYGDAAGSRSCGFSGGGVDLLRDGLTVVEDGYAVAYTSTNVENPIPSIGASLTVTYETAKGVQETVQVEYSGSDDMYSASGVNQMTGEEEAYYLLPLPGDMDGGSNIVNSGYAAEHFYQAITIRETVESTVSEPRSYYYNPHFAETVLPHEEDLDLAAEAQNLQVWIRTPRHLYMLSRYAAYFSSAHQYAFFQDLDLDYRTYTGYGLFGAAGSAFFPQAPIGADSASPFRGTYDGGAHVITGVLPDPGADRTHVGLFGYSVGILRDIVYRMDGGVLDLTRSGSGTVCYVGGLAGCLLGLLWALAPGKGRGRRELAFGPFLSAGWALTVLFGQGIIDWYLGLLA